MVVRSPQFDRERAIKLASIETDKVEFFENVELGTILEHVQGTRIMQKLKAQIYPHRWPDLINALQQCFQCFINTGQTY